MKHSLTLVLGLTIYSTNCVAQTTYVDPSEMSCAERKTKGYCHGICTDHNGKPPSSCVDGIVADSDLIIKNLSPAQKEQLKENLSEVIRNMMEN